MASFHQSLRARAARGAIWRYLALSGAIWRYLTILFYLILSGDNLTKIPSRSEVEPAAGRTERRGSAGAGRPGASHACAADNEGNTHAACLLYTKDVDTPVRS